MNDGGPAFPQGESYTTHSQVYGDTRHQKAALKPGMTLRDYFAAKALQGFAANPAVFAPNGMNGWSLVNCTHDELCAFAYHIADRMLDVREEPQPQKGLPE